MDSPAPGADVIALAVEAAGKIDMSRACQELCRLYAKAYLDMIREDELLVRRVRDARDEEERRAIENAKGKWNPPKPVDVTRDMESALVTFKKASDAAAGLLAKPDLPAERRRLLDDLLIRYRHGLNEIGSLVFEIQLEIEDAPDDLAKHRWSTPGTCNTKPLDPFRLWVVWTAQAWREGGLNPTGGRGVKAGWRTSPFQRFMWSVWELIGVDRLTRKQFSEKVHNILRKPPKRTRKSRTG